MKNLEDLADDVIPGLEIPVALHGLEFDADLMPIPNEFFVELMAISIRASRST